MTKITNPYLTIVNAKTKYNPDDFKGFEYEKVDIAMGDWGKKNGLIERQTNIAYKRAIEELESIGATCTLNSAGRTQFDQVYAKLEKFAGVLKKSKSIKKAFTDTKTLTAKLGYSEHLSALAVDVSINTDIISIPKKILQRYPDASLPELKFFTKRFIMEKNGFILSYPQDERLEQVTGLKKPEGWHWRYVGAEHSQTIAKIREKVRVDLDEKHEVFLEDYVKLLGLDIKAESEQELLQQYADYFIKNIIKFAKKDELTV